MKFLSDIFTNMGEHFALIVILLAVVYLKSRNMRARKKQAMSLLPDLNFGDMPEAALVLRRNDKFPMFVSDNFERVTGLSLKSVNRRQGSFICKAIRAST